jgi:hypothetical protein
MTADAVSPRGAAPGLADAVACRGCTPRARIVGRMTFIAWSSDRRRIGASIP